MTEKPIPNIAEMKAISGPRFTDGTRGIFLGFVQDSELAGVFDIADAMSNFLQTDAFKGLNLSQKQSIVELLKQTPDTRIKEWYSKVSAIVLSISQLAGRELSQSHLEFIQQKIITIVENTSQLMAVKSLEYDLAGGEEEINAIFLEEMAILSLFLDYFNQFAFVASEPTSDAPERQRLKKNQSDLEKLTKDQSDSDGASERPVLEKQNIEAYINRFDKMLEFIEDSARPPIYLSDDVDNISLEFREIENWFADKIRDNPWIEWEKKERLERKMLLAKYKVAMRALEYTISYYELENKSMGAFFKDNAKFQKQHGYNHVVDVMIRVEKQSSVIDGESGADLALRMEKKFEESKREWAYRILSYASFVGLKPYVIGTGKGARTYPDHNIDFYTTNQVMSGIIHNDNPFAMQEKNKDLLYVGEVAVNPVVFEDVFRMNIGKAVRPDEDNFMGARIVGREDENWIKLKSELRLMPLLMMAFTEMLSTNSKFEINYTNYGEENSLETIVGIFRSKVWKSFIDDYVVPHMIRKRMVRMGSNQEDIDEVIQQVERFKSDVADIQIKKAFHLVCQLGIPAKFGDGAAAQADVPFYTRDLSYLWKDYLRRAKDINFFRLALFAQFGNSSIWEIIDETVKEINAIKDGRQFWQRMIDTTMMPRNSIKQRVDTLCHEESHHSGMPLDQLSHLMDGYFVRIDPVLLYDPRIAASSADAPVVEKRNERGEFASAHSSFSGRKLGPYTSGMRGALDMLLLKHSNGYPRRVREGTDFDHILSLGDLVDEYGMFRFELIKDESVYGDLFTFYNNVAIKIGEFYRDVLSPSAGEIGPGLHAKLAAFNKTAMYAMHGMPRWVGQAAQINQLNAEREKDRLAELMLLADSLYLIFSGKSLHDVTEMIKASGKHIDSRTKHLVEKIITGYFGLPLWRERYAKTLFEQIVNKLKFS